MEIVIRKRLEFYKLAYFAFMIIPTINMAFFELMCVSDLVANCLSSEIF